MKRTIVFERQNTESSSEYLTRVIKELEYKLINKGCSLHKVSVKVESITDDPLELLKNEIKS